MKKKIENVSSINVDGKVYIELNSLLSLLNSKEIHKNRKNETFRNKVWTLWSKCIATDAKPWLNKENIIGEALGVDYCFSKDKLITYYDEIISLISEVNNAKTYDDLKVLNNGDNWTILRQQISFLMALGNAIKVLDFKKPRYEWKDSDLKNPEIEFNLTKTKK